MNKGFLLNLVKLLLALIIGGFLGVKFLARGFENGEIAPFIIFFVLCSIIGFVFAKVDIKK